MQEKSKIAMDGKSKCKMPKVAGAHGALQPCYGS